jgi:NitT/TauT family transport system permease protein
MSSEFSEPLATIRADGEARENREDSSRPPSAAHGLIFERTEPVVNERQARSAGVRPGRGIAFRLATLARTVSGLILLAAAWELLPKLHVVDPHFVTPFGRVVATWWHLLGDGMLWQQVKPSLIRAGIGFGAAVVIGIPLGAAIAWYRPVREVVTPVLEIFRNTAALAILPVFTLILGIGELTKYTIVCYACLFPILLNTISGISNVDKQLMRTARVLGLSPVATFRKVALPAAMPTIFTGIRISGAVSVMVLLAAEMVGATAGLGYFINASEQGFQVPEMYAGILSITLLGLVINYGLLLLEKRLSGWKTA